jgi:hypothetical protein
MAEEAKQYVHPNREKALKGLQGIIDFVSIKSASGWTPPDFIYGITSLTRLLVRTTNQALNDAERLQRQIDDLKEEIGQLKAGQDGGASVTVHVLPGEERNGDAE